MDELYIPRDEIDPYQKLRFRRPSIKSNYLSLIHRSMARSLSNAYDGGELPMLKDANPYEKIELLKKKILVCNQIFNYFEPVDVYAKEYKKKTLSEILEYLIHGKDTLCEEIYPHLIDMIGYNLFREMSPRLESTLYDDEEPIEMSNPLWPHLVLVYEVFEQIFCCLDFRASYAEPYINKDFIKKFINLMDSEDTRERLMLKSLLHTIYKKIINVRIFVRDEIALVLTKYNYCGELIYGIPELLEVLESIISGFIVPLKTMHCQYLIRNLLPLYRNYELPYYHQQLAACVDNFLLKKPALSRNTFEALSKYWPKTNSKKQMLFLDHCLRYMLIIPRKEFQNFAPIVFKNLANCIRGTQFFITYKSICLLLDETITEMTIANLEVFLPILLPSLVECSKTKHKFLQSLAYLLIKAYGTANKPLLEQNMKMIEQHQREVEDRKKVTESAWKFVLKQTTMTPAQNNS